MNESVINMSVSPEVSSSVVVGQSGLAPSFIDQIPVVGKVISSIINFLAGVGDKFLGIQGNVAAEWFFVGVCFLLVFIVLKKVITR